MLKQAKTCDQVSVCINGEIPYIALNLKGKPVVKSSIDHAYDAIDTFIADIHQSAIERH